MRNLQEYANLCKELLDDLGIECGPILGYDVITRSKRKFGTCVSEHLGYVIKINVELLDEHNSEDGLIETILHEQLHTCDGCFNHGPCWKALADKVNKAYGYNIKTSSTFEEKGICAPRVAKYNLVCQGCGHVYNHYRACNATKHPQYYRCALCNSGLNLVVNY